MPNSPAGEAPSLFSFVYRSAHGETVVLNDSQPARSRKFTFRMHLSSKRHPGPIRAESTESLHTIGSAEDPNWTYKASYPPSVVEQEVVEFEVENPSSDDLTRISPPSSKPVMWLKAFQSKLFAVGRALHLCAP